MTIADVNAARAAALVVRARSLGYVRARVLPDGSVAALAQLISTRAVVLGVTVDSWAKRFCFTDPELADQRYEELQSEDDEPLGYIARRGR